MGRFSHPAEGRGGMGAAVEAEGASGDNGPAAPLLPLPSPPLPVGDESARAADQASVTVAGGGSVAGDRGGDGGEPRLG
ncbi:hypothetical protein [Oryza sativa Japonica Group]|uniref:Uncharacterized protein n=2 Tax=Oryza sativa subsp. japonica TaxID=39947 RepID=Q7F473_ORYSJ|nr:hypothetical protein [Oryza sativa Japonica Group]BAC10724.1 hypothetical protein [Oryza sativa Japonica Group]